MKTIVQKKIIKTLYSSELELQIEKCRENEKKKKYMKGVRHTLTNNLKS